jgi:hypothetical protein
VQEEEWEGGVSCESLCAKRLVGDLARRKKEFVGGWCGCMVCPNAEAG